jgi:hypothetical protein
MNAGKTAVRVVAVTAGVALLGPIVVIGGALAVAYFVLRRIHSEMAESDEPKQVSIVAGAVPPPSSSGKCQPVSAGYDKDPAKGPVVLPGAVYDGPELATPQQRAASAALQLIDFDTGTLWPPTFKQQWTNLNGSLAVAGVSGSALQLWYLREAKAGRICLPGTLVAWSDTARVSNLAAMNPSTNKFEYERQVRLARNRVRSYRAALILWHLAGRPSLAS